MSRQPDMFARVGAFDVPAPHNRTPTSHQAARAIRPKAGTLRAAVLDFIASRGAYGATDAEICAALSMDPSTERPRRGELARAGLIRKTILTRPTPAGRQAAVWVALTDPDETG